MSCGIRDKPKWENHSVDTDGSGAKLRHLQQRILQLFHDSSSMSWGPGRDKAST